MLFSVRNLFHSFLHNNKDVVRTLSRRALNTQSAGYRGRMASTTTNNRQQEKPAESAEEDITPLYQETIATLNSLQSNAAVLHQAKLNYGRNGQLNLDKTVEYLSRTGITLDDIDDRLRVIHVSGTKGKGSTCAFCESVLRRHGLKTGLYTSPHLVAVRERIRINGQPLDKHTFSSYFWKVYNKLRATRGSDDGRGLPAYFKFLTLMAFHVFLEERVDVAIIEVGIGGSYDCTNIIRRPVVCGVTSLGLDHTTLLGDTVEKIAQHKAGIFKPQCPAITVPQPGQSLQVLIDRAQAVDNPLYLCPDLHAYDWSECGGRIELGLQGEIQYWNATLALQLSRTFLQAHASGFQPQTPHTTTDMEVAPVFPVSTLMCEGMKRCVWPGRSQVIPYPQLDLTFYLDGAHTPRSIQFCCKWFLQASTNHRKDVTRVLLFNSTGDRQPEHLLYYLKKLCKFDLVLFCPNKDSLTTDIKSDNLNLLVSSESQLARCYTNRDAWLGLSVPEATTVPPSPPHHPHTCHCSDLLSTSAEVPPQLPPASEHHQNGGGVSSPAQGDTITRVDECYTFPCISSALFWLSGGRLLEEAAPVPPSLYYPPQPPCLTTSSHLHVLVTGSFHLVGGVLGLLQPDLDN